MTNWYKEYNEACDRASKLCKILGRLEGELKALMYQIDDPEIKQYIQDKLTQSEKDFNEMYQNNTNKGE